MLPKVQGFVAAVLGPLGQGDLSTVAREIREFDSLVRSRNDIHDVLTDTSIANIARGNIVHELLNGKVHPSTLRLLSYVAVHSPAQHVPKEIDELVHAAHRLSEGLVDEVPSLSLLEARRRVGGFADAHLEDVSTDNFTGIEDDLFRWARYVEANGALRRELVDRDAPLQARISLTTELLSGKVSATALALATYVIVGGRPRDVVGTLDFLVDYVAKSRDWRVARVFTARAMDNQTREQLTASLRAVSGKNVELEVAEDPSLLGGVLVEMGDLRVDATTRGRLGSLRDAVSPGHFYESNSDR
jgi:F-type H+-transporting ATPase subunit delta